MLSSLGADSEVHGQPDTNAPQGVRTSKGGGRGDRTTSHPRVPCTQGGPAARATALGWKQPAPERKLRCWPECGRSSKECKLVQLNFFKNYDKKVGEFLITW